MGNLKERLKRIHEIKNIETNGAGEDSFAPHDISALIKNGWETCGFKVLKRDVSVKSPFKNIKSLPSNLSILIPDLKSRELPCMENFIFFDLETTGLSGGAGTVAFLAAFGKISDNKLIITQYLLLDYPGENNFLEKTLSILNEKDAIIVSYNGKCFDSQIIKTRCLMNRMPLPVYNHVDLLHPSRRLWKNIINDCSQASVETKILGLSREGDIPGSLAPEIWFEFLRTGETERLEKICDHNTSDISGLSEILSAIIAISQNLFENSEYKYDKERLAHFVYKYAYKQMLKNNYNEPLKLIKKGIKVIKNDQLLHDKMIRRKNRLEKLIEMEKMKS